MHARLIERLSSLPGKLYPAHVRKAWSADRVPALQGLLITGDLTELGLPDQWSLFLQHYGTPGAPGNPSIPVMEVIGNHDRAGGNEYVTAQVAARHGGGRFYAYKWGDVRFWALGEAPDAAGLAFVEHDLASVDRDVPLVVYFHLATLGP